MRVRVRSRLLTALCALLSAASQPVSAHIVPDPKYGGMVAASAHVDFELVAVDGVVTMFVEDHGELLSTDGMQGHLEVSIGDQKQSVPLLAVAPNLLVAQGVYLQPGALPYAVVLMPRRGFLRVRFPSVKAAAEE